jgi:Cu-Zn family superoxide dismutase
MERHAGDLGNLKADEYGKATLSMMVDGISVGKGVDGVIGRGVIVHADADDLKTDPSGNSGARIGCGVIES